MSIFTNEQEAFIDHEVRIRTTEGIYKELKEEIRDLRKDINHNFIWTIGIILSSILLPIVLHWVKLL